MNRLQIPNLVSKGVLKAKLITTLPYLTVDLQINILKFVSGHGNVVQSSCTNIVQGDTKKTVITKNQTTSKILFRLTQNVSYIR